ncbi:transmembrane protein, putative [Medicago truncatula]|uniref:Transmembrane protein, putative n=1 Tax=Medicago truncatula TaxID=3880 RepID=G7K8U1_MEDTR|nr:transmembrane protein, putative [Medicago truncatula]
MGGGEEKHLEDCSVSNALGTWVFSVAGALLAIPVGIKRKSLAPLVIFWEHAERQMQLLEAQNAAAETSLEETHTDS